MKNRILTTILLCAFTATAIATDNTVAFPKFNSGNDNQVNAATTDDGSGHQRMVVVPPTITANNDATSTAATGTNWTALATHTAKKVTIINTTGTTISVRYGSGTAIGLPDGSGFTFEGLTNSNGLSIKRADDSNTQVSVAFNYQNW